MTDQLTTLYDLSKKLEAAGIEPFFPKCLQYEREWYNDDCGPYAVWLYTDDHGFGGYEFEDQHALAIVKDEAERMLRAEGWEPYGWDKYTNPSLESREQAILLGPLTLTEAVAYEVERQINTKGNNQ